MTGLHPHPGPAVGTLLQSSSTYSGSMQGVVFKKGPEGMGYYADVGKCTLQLAPLLLSEASVPGLPIRLFFMLGLGNASVPALDVNGSAAPRYPSGPSGNAARRTRGGQRKHRNKTRDMIKSLVDDCPFVGVDARKTSGARVLEGPFKRPWGPLRRSLGEFWFIFVRRLA